MNCHACGAKLEPVEPATELDLLDPDFVQYDNALPIVFDGGYGMFHDDIDAGCRYKVIICHECAHDLCDKVEWIKKLIDPPRSHSHHVDYVSEHPAHYGWDYEMAKPCPACGHERFNHSYVDGKCQELGCDKVCTELLSL